VSWSDVSGDSKQGKIFHVQSIKKVCKVKKKRKRKKIHFSLYNEANVLLILQIKNPH